MTERMEEVSTMQAIWIGHLPDRSAVFPGTSAHPCPPSPRDKYRMSRLQRWNFSSSSPSPMVAATGYDLLRTLQSKQGAPARRYAGTPHQWTVLAIGLWSRSSGPGRGGLVHELGPPRGSRRSPFYRIVLGLRSWSGDERTCVADRLEKHTSKPSFHHGGTRRGKLRLDLCFAKQTISLSILYII